MKFQKLYDRIKKLQTPLNQILEDVLKDNDIEESIIKLNQEQLYDQGVQADGSTTGQYTEDSKIQKYWAGVDGTGDSRSDHITGKDTGETYASMQVKINPDSFIITADDRNDFFEEHAPKGLGLTNESIKEILPEVKQLFIEKYKKAIGFA